GEWVLSDPAGDRPSLTLLQESGLAAVSDDPAGRDGRAQVLDPFDALGDFMRYDAQIPGRGTVGRLGSNATIPVGEWGVQGPAAVRALQAGVRDLWWRLSGDRECRRARYAEMRALRDADATFLSDREVRE